MIQNNEKCCGIMNIGNICYMNSIIQCLANSNKLFEYITSEEFNEDIRTDLPEKNLSMEFRKILIKLHTEQGAINPQIFCQQFQKYMIQNPDLSLGINIGNHNDAQEFLIILLEILHISLSYTPEININITDQNLSNFDKLALSACNTWKTHFKNKYSKIVELFYGQFISEVQNVDDLSHCFDPYQILTLEIPKIRGEITIEKCLQKFMSNEKIDNIYRQFFLWSSPPILIVSLKRFDLQGNKNNTRVIYKEILDLSKYSKGFKREKIKYRLCGICCHSGENNFGHYISLCRNKKSENWYRYDDNNVSLITKNNVIPLTSLAYILFYELI